MKKLFITILLCLSPLSLQAAPTEIGIGIQYREPTMSQCEPSNDCPLDDLKGTKIYMDVIKDGVSGTVTTINASALTGGGLIEKEFCVPIIDTEFTADRVEIEVTAFDLSGNESQKTPKLVVQVQGARDCSPLPPPDTTAPLGVENLSLK